MMMPSRSSNSRSTPVSSKASDPTKRLMVNPIPHSAAVPYKLSQFISLGNFASPSLMHNQQIPNMPICFPKNNPNAIPIGTSWSTCSMPTPLIFIPALENAKTGRMKKATTEWRSCSRLFSGETLRSRFDRMGMNIARMTPASVAWTPDLTLCLDYMLRSCSKSLIQEQLPRHFIKMFV